MMKNTAKAIVMVVSVIALMAGIDLVNDCARTPDIVLVVLGAFGVGASIAGYVMALGKK